jgi:hypothetical protein
MPTVCYPVHMGWHTAAPFGEDLNMSTRTITFELPESVMIGGPAGHDLRAYTATWTPEFVWANALHGLKQRRTDKLSVSKDKTKLAELDARIQAGEDLSGGGRGSSLDDASEALHRWLNKQGKDTKGNKKDLAERLLSFCRVYVTEDLEQAEMERLLNVKNATELTALASAVKDEVLGLIHEQPSYEKVVAEIEAEKHADKGQARAKLVLGVAKTGLKKATHG